MDRQSRRFECITTDYPAFFNFDGRYFEEYFNVDCENTFVEVNNDYAKLRLLTLEEQRTRDSRASDAALAELKRKLTGT